MLGISFLSFAHSTYANTNSVNFDGSDDYITIGEPANLSLTLTANELTFAAWIYVPTGSDLSGFPAIISKAQPGVPNFGYLLGINTVGSLYGYWGGTTGNTAGTIGEITNDVWHLVGWNVINKLGVYTGQLWLNGVQTALDVPLTAVANANNGIASGISVLFGASAAAGTVRKFHGLIDEITFWSTGFTQANWTSLYNAGHPTNPNSHPQAANLIHWYRMGEGDTYPTILDRKGVNDGTMTNMSAASITTSHA